MPFETAEELRKRKSLEQEHKFRRENVMKRIEEFEKKKRSQSARIRQREFEKKLIRPQTSDSNKNLTREQF